MAFFTIFDAKKGYLHVRRRELLPHNFQHAIRPISLQTCPIHFVLVVSQDVFQKQLDTAFEGRDGVTGITDDTFVYGSSEVEHDRNLTKLMETAKRRARYSTKTKCGSRLRKSSFFFDTPGRHKESNMITRKYQRS